MIDRALVEKMARFAVRNYASDPEECNICREISAVFATVDEFTPALPSHDDIEAEIDAINDMYLAQTARRAVVHWLREGWARERIARRKEMEAMSR